MSAVSKKIFLAFAVLMMVLTTGAWQSTPVALVKGMNAESVETPLYPGLTWLSRGGSSQNVRINIDGDAISLSGEKFEAQERLVASLPLPQDVVDYYSNEQLAKSGWSSHDVFSGPDGTHYVFYHESGVYLSVDFVTCQDDASSTCVSVWKSEQVNSNAAIAPGAASDLEAQTATSSFGKKSPANGTTNLNPASITLSWEAYSPTPDKYKYCIQEGSACAYNDPDWTSTYNTSVTITNLASNKTYYWQIQAVTCVTCTPKTTVDADGGSVWKFTTSTSSQIVILGNAGVASAVLSYVDGSAKTVTADGTGAYRITLPYNWSGTITPSKTGYLFSPKSATFTNAIAAQIIQNFAAIPAYTISGNVGVAGAILSYTDGTPKTVTSDSSGNYSILVPAGWSGTVTPSSAGYSFSPANRTYSTLAANQTTQNYTATYITYTISGNVGAAGVTLHYTNLYPGSVTSAVDGSYSFKVPQGWSGTVTPSQLCYTFNPLNRPYSNVQADQTAQNYTATASAICVSAILRANPSPTNASAVNYSVIFTEPVTGVDPTDFSLTTAGAAGATVQTVTGSGASYTVAVSTGSGNGTIRLDLIDNDSIKNAGNHPLGGAGAGNGNFTGGEIYTILKSQTFTDVPSTNQYYSDIEVLYVNGLTAGCSTNPLKFCPDQIMDRAQAAVFMVRGSLGSGYTPNPSANLFQDNWSKGTWARPWAESMREANLTTGCKTSPLLYCPWDQLPREQLVIFGLKLKYGNFYQPPPATGTVFADMTNPAYYATPWAEQAYKDALIPACGASNGKPLFCPQNVASRGLGAYIIVRAKGLITP